MQQKTRDSTNDNQINKGHSDDQDTASIFPEPPPLASKESPSSEDIQVTDNSYVIFDESSHSSKKNHEVLIEEEIKPIFASLLYDKDYDECYSVDINERSIATGDNTSPRSYNEETAESIGAGICGADTVSKNVVVTSLSIIEVQGLPDDVGYGEDPHCLQLADVNENVSMPSQEDGRYIEPEELSDKSNERVTEHELKDDIVNEEEKLDNIIVTNLPVNENEDVVVFPVMDTTIFDEINKEMEDVNDQKLFKDDTNVVVNVTKEIESTEYLEDDKINVVEEKDQDVDVMEDIGNNEVIECKLPMVSEGEGTSADGEADTGETFEKCQDGEDRDNINEEIIIDTESKDGLFREDLIGEYNADKNDSAEGGPEDFQRGAFDTYVDTVVISQETKIMDPINEESTKCSSSDEVLTSENEECPNDVLNVEQEDALLDYNADFIIHTNDGNINSEHVESIDQGNEGVQEIDNGNRDAEVDGEEVDVDSGNIDEEVAIDEVDVGAIEVKDVETEESDSVSPNISIEGDKECQEVEEECDDDYERSEFFDAICDFVDMILEEVEGLIYRDSDGIVDAETDQIPLCDHEDVILEVKDENERGIERSNETDITETEEIIVPRYSSLLYDEDTQEVNVAEMSSNGLNTEDIVDGKRESKDIDNTDKDVETEEMIVPRYCSLLFDEDSNELSALDASTNDITDINDTDDVVKNVSQECEDVNTDEAEEAVGPKQCSSQYDDRLDNKDNVVESKGECGNEKELTVEMKEVASTIVIMEEHTGDSSDNRDEDKSIVNIGEEIIKNEEHMKYNERTVINNDENEENEKMIENKEEVEEIKVSDEVESMRCDVFPSEEVKQSLGNENENKSDESTIIDKEPVDDKVECNDEQTSVNTKEATETETEITDNKIIDEDEDKGNDTIEDHEEIEVEEELINDKGGSQDDLTNADVEEIVDNKDSIKDNDANISKEDNVDIDTTATERHNNEEDKVVEIIFTEEEKEIMQNKDETLVEEKENIDDKVENNEDNKGVSSSVIDFAELMEDKIENTDFVIAKKEDIKDNDHKGSMVTDEAGTFSNEEQTLGDELIIGGEAIVDKVECKDDVTIVQLGESIGDQKDAQDVAISDEEETIVNENKDFKTAKNEGEENMVFVEEKKGAEYSVDNVNEDEPKDAEPMIIGVATLESRQGSEDDTAMEVKEIIVPKHCSLLYDVTTEEECPYGVCDAGDVEVDEVIVPKHCSLLYDDNVEEKTDFKCVDTSDKDIVSQEFIDKEYSTDRMYDVFPANDQIPFQFDAIQLNCQSPEDETWEDSEF